MISEIHNMDCMDLMRKYPDKHFDLAVVDPPYGIDINKSGRLGHYGGKGKKWDSNTPDASYFKELIRISKNTVIWGGNYFNLPPCRCFLIWDKKQPVGVSFADCEYAWTTLEESARIFRMRPQNADDYRIHPTQKPVALYDWIFKNYAKEGQLILDTHLGSGSSRIAADRAGLNFVGCELDADYFAAHEKRWNEYKAQLKLL